MGIKVMFALLILANLLTSIPNSSEQAAQGSNWRYPAFDQRNSGYNPQTIVNKDNINSLELRWIFQVPGYFEGLKGLEGYENPHIPTGIQTVPLSVNGIVYFAADYNRLFAIRAEDKALLWKFTVPVGTFENEKWWSRTLAQHSISYHDDTVWMLASDCTVYGLEPFTGEVKVTIPDTCKDVEGNTGVYFGSFSPLIFKNVLITGPSGGIGERGFVAAYDINTGKLLWRWFSIPPSGGDVDWDEKTGASKGNMRAYKGDWGGNDLIGGGSVWSLIALDEDSGTIYFPTSGPTPDYDAAQRPGPNLYASSIVALDVMTGQMKWYYQLNPHDINQHESRWSVILADINMQGSMRKVVVAAAKSNYVYVLDANTGQLVYDPVKVGPASKNVLNSNSGNNADLNLSQKSLLGKEVCPGFLGGIDAAPAFAYQTVFVASQTFCTSVEERTTPYKGKAIEGLEHLTSSRASGESSLYAIDASNGKIKWVFNIPNRQQYAAVTVSGGIVFIPDRQGNVYAVDQKDGRLLRKWDFGGLGGAGVSIGATARGEMMLFMASGGSGEVGTRTTGIVTAFGLPRGSTSAAPSDLFGPNSLGLLGFGIAVASLAYALVLTRRYRKK